MGNTSSSPLRHRRRRNAVSPASDLVPLPEHQYLKPNGLYPTCQWDPKTVRRLILRAELAPRYPGLDDPTEAVREECPICMLVYPVLNETRCCQARLCTECYLQIRPPRHNKEPCPFCKYKRVEAAFKGPRDKLEIEREEMDEKRATEAMKRANLAAAAMSVEMRNARDLSAQPSAQAQQMVSAPDSCAAPASSASTDPRCIVHEASSAASSASIPPIAQFTFPPPPCDCPDNAPVPSNHACPHHDDYRVRYYHDKAPGIDPLLLEAMASEVTFASPPGSAADRASASSSGRLDVHVRDLRADVGSESDAESMSYLAEVGHRVVRLPWYGVDVDRAAHIGPGPRPTPVGPSAEGDGNVEDIHHVEKVSLNEAIRRSLIDM